MFVPIVMATVIAVQAAAADHDSWQTADQAALAAAHRYTMLSNMLQREVGVAILFDPRSGRYSYSHNVHEGDYAVTIDATDGADVPQGYQYVGTWHAHPLSWFDSLDGHIATIEEHKTIVVWTSYEGEVVAQFWDAQLNGGRGGVHSPVDICPTHFTCVPFPQV